MSRVSVTRPSRRPCGSICAAVPWSAGVRFCRGGVRGDQSETARAARTAATRSVRPDGGDLAAICLDAAQDRKSTRLNSSHQIISYAVFCLKKKKERQYRDRCRYRQRDKQEWHAYDPP